jgi:hypothetical protein
MVGRSPTVLHYKAGFFCVSEITPPIRNRMQTMNERKLKVIKVTPDKIPAKSIIAPQPFGFSCKEMHLQVQLKLLLNQSIKMHFLHRLSIALSHRQQVLKVLRHKPLNR